MSNLQRKRLPAIRCWIRHILEGKSSNDNNMIKSIFGDLKRVRLIGTIFEKKIKVSSEEHFNEASKNNFNDPNARIELDLDDGTGLIQTNIWNVNPHSYKVFKKGDIVDIVGLINNKYDKPSISVEIIKKIQNPNKQLLRNIEIIKKIKYGNTFDLEDTKEESLDNDLLFLEQSPNGIDQDKEKIFSIIEVFTQNGVGISLTNLKNKMDITEDKLRRHIRDLEMESRIYQSEENFYQTY